MTISRRTLCTILLATAALPQAVAAQDFDELRRMRLERATTESQATRQRVVRERTETVRERVVRERPARAAKPAPEPRAPSWTVQAGSDLQSTLNAWSERAGWKLLWQSDFVYEINSGSTFQGSFHDSVKALILAMKDVRPTPTATFYGGNRTLVLSNDGRGSTD